VKLYLGNGVLGAVGGIHEKVASRLFRQDPIQGQLSYIDAKEISPAKGARSAKFIDDFSANHLKTSGFLQSLG
jgi:hypothetical protein